MKVVIVLTYMTGLGLGTWLCVILINGARKRIETVNRRRAERKRRSGGYE